MKPPSRIRFPFRKEERPLVDYQVIGHRWKHSNVCSLMILIGRGLDLKALRGEVSQQAFIPALRIAHTQGLRPYEHVRDWFGLRQPYCHRLLCGFQGAVSMGFGGFALALFLYPFARLFLFNCIHFPVTMARGFHLFPFRTQQLSLFAPNVLGWTRPGRLGRRRNSFSPWRSTIWTARGFCVILMN